MHAYTKIIMALEIPLTLVDLLRVDCHNLSTRLLYSSTRVIVGKLPTICTTSVHHSNFEMIKKLTQDCLQETGSRDRPNHIATFELHSGTSHL